MRGLVTSLMVTMVSPPGCLVRLVTITAEVTPRGRLVVTGCWWVTHWPGWPGLPVSAGGGERGHQAQCSLESRAESVSGQ